MSLKFFFGVSIFLFALAISAFLNFRNDTTWRYNASLIGMILLGIVFIAGVFAVLKKKKA